MIMGVRGRLSEVSLAVFTRLQAGEEVNEDQDTLRDMPSAFLDKCWYDFHVIFKQAELPLRYVLEGDYPHPSSPVNIDTYLANNGDYFFGFVSPTLVKAI